MVIDDAELRVFMAMLEHLYTDTIEIPSDIALPLLCTADRFGVERLKALCAAKLEAELSPATACAVLVVADRHSAADLREARRRTRPLPRRPLRPPSAMPSRHPPGDHRHHPYGRPPPGPGGPPGGAPYGGAGPVSGVANSQASNLLRQQLAQQPPAAPRPPPPQQGASAELNKSAAELLRQQLRGGR